MTVSTNSVVSGTGLYGSEVDSVRALVSGAGIRSRRVRSMLGAEAFDLVGLTGLPAGASFSGSGTYANAGVLAVQSTGTITHNPTGWYDGTACLEFTPNADSAEFRVFVAAGVNISDDDGLAFEFGIPDDLDTSKQNYSIYFDYSSDAANAFPANTAYTAAELAYCSPPVTPEP